MFLSVGPGRFGIFHPVPDNPHDDLLLATHRLGQRGKAAGFHSIADGFAVWAAYSALALATVILSWLIDKRGATDANEPRI